ncbi:MAG: hypothetical protein WAS21_26130 [Geminicoccaceae bacterium]
MVLSVNFRRSMAAIGMLTAAVAMVGAGTPAMADPDIYNQGPAARDSGVAPSSTPGDRAACINGTGAVPTIAYSKGTLSVTRIATGTYIVLFNRNVRNCVKNATIGLCGFVGVSPPGEITTVSSVAFFNGVFVTTHNSFGARSDRSFHLLVTCE